MTVQSKWSDRLGGAAAAVCLIGGGVAHAAIPDANGVIHGCYVTSSGTIRIIDDAVTTCRPSETAVQWNISGPIGPQGPAGAQGPHGETGATGLQGPVGPSDAYVFNREPTMQIGSSLQTVGSLSVPAGSCTSLSAKALIENRASVSAVSQCLLFVGPDFLDAGGAVLSATFPATRKRDDVAVRLRQRRSAPQAAGGTSAVLARAISPRFVAAMRVSPGFILSPPRGTTPASSVPVTPEVYACLRGRRIQGVVQCTCTPVSCVFSSLCSVGCALSGASASAVFAQSHFAGPIGPGSSYEIDVPAVWNGDLVLYAHGIVQADEPVAPPTNQDGYDQLRTALLGQGYAVAASSFSTNGWSLDDAVRRTHQLSGIFKSKAGQPRRTFLVGHSMGALAIVKLAEKHPGSVRRGAAHVRTAWRRARRNCSTPATPA